MRGFKAQRITSPAQRISSPAQRIRLAHRSDVLSKLVAQVQEQGKQIQLLQEKLKQKEASVAAAVEVRVAAAVPTTPPQAPSPFEKVTQISDPYSVPVGSGIAIFGIERAKLKEVVERLVQSKLGLSKEE